MSSPDNSEFARLPFTCGDSAGWCASIDTETCSAASTSLSATSFWSKGKVVATVRQSHRLSLFNQPHKVQYEAYAFFCGSLGGHASILKPYPSAHSPYARCTSGS